MLPETKKEAIRKVSIFLILAGIVLALWQTRTYSTAQDPSTITMPALRIGSGIFVFAAGICVSIWNKYSKPA